MDDLQPVCAAMDGIEMRIRAKIDNNNDNNDREEPMDKGYMSKDQDQQQISEVQKLVDPQPQRTGSRQQPVQSTASHTPKIIKTVTVATTTAMTDQSIFLDTSTLD